MIRQDEYMPSVVRMDEREASEYWSDFCAWLRDSLPQLQASRVWGKEEEAVFDRGLRLLSAFARARDFVETAYRWSTTEKRISNFLYYVEQVHKHLVMRGITEGGFDSRRGGVRFVDQYVMKRGARQSAKQAISQEKVRMKEVASEQIDTNEEEDDDRRPQHFDQYKHLLPLQLRKEGEKIGDLYVEFADVCNKLERVADNPNGTKQDRAYYARTACSIEDRIKNFWHRVDIAYAQVKGKEVSEEYINVINQETEKVNAAPRERQGGEYTKMEIDQMEEGEEKERCRKLRIERDKQLLRKADRKGDERHAQNLLSAASELHEWGILITETQRNVCEQYGVELDASWIEPSKEEKKALQAERRRERNRESYQRAKAKKMVGEMNEECPYDVEGVSLYD